MTIKINPLLSKSEALALSWKNRATYKGYDKTKGSIYNSWRAIVYNRKGKKIGFPESWKNFDDFNKEVGSGWSRGLILVRLDSQKPYSTDNVRWANKGEECIHSLAKLTYNGKEQTLLEWAKELDISYAGLRQRYFKGREYTAEQILFGKMKNLFHKEIKDITELSKQKAKDKVSCMLGAYRHKDKIRKRQFNITHDFLRKAMASPCSYCGDTKNVGLDRINNSLGHTMDNCIPCCYVCNTTRNNNFTHEEMIELGKTVATIKAKRKHEDN